jgi:23S rRNA pseudouridine2605 synthase
LRVNPMTSWPWAWSSTAVAEESTPPLIPTSTRVFLMDGSVVIPADYRPQNRGVKAGQGVNAGAGGVAAGERIAKRLSRAGVASRRAAEAMIAEGRVAVNGRVIESPALNVEPGDRISVDGRPLPEAEPPRLWRYHKPPGLITTMRDQRGRPTVFEALPEDLPRVMSVGRLDLTSEGLLLLTNDGELKHRLESPATGWTRRYRVRAKGTPEDAALEPLRRGITVDGERFRPMTVSIDRQQGANVWLTVALTEGRYREVRRALEAVGLTVNRLIRLSYGPFQLGDLAPGAVEEVRPRVLRDQLGLSAEAFGEATAEKRPATKPRRGRGPGAPRVRSP